MYSPDGQWLVTASNDHDHTARIWNADTGQQLMTLTGPRNKVPSEVYSPDEQWIVTDSDDGIVQIYTTDMDELLEIAKGQVTRQLTVEEKERYGVLIDSCLPSNKSMNAPD